MRQKDKSQNGKLGLWDSYGTFGFFSIGVVQDKRDMKNKYVKARW